MQGPMEDLQSAQTRHQDLASQAAFLLAAISVTKSPWVLTQGSGESRLMQTLALLVLIAVALILLAIAMLNA